MAKTRLLFIPVLFLMILFLSKPSHAASLYALGKTNVSLKADYLVFRENGVKDNDIDKGYYAGVSAYTNLLHPFFYVGGETGFGYTYGTVDVLGTKVDTSLSYIPIELNAVLSVPETYFFIVNFGLGVSYNYIIEHAAVGTSTVKTTDWLLGGQAFVDINLRMSKQFFFGIDGKYKITEDFKRKDAQGKKYDFSNMSFGAHVGLIF